MDGNGRWATDQGHPRLVGHHAGAEAVRRTVEAAAEYGLGTLTLFAFSGDNWRRPPSEVNGLMRLFRDYLLTEAVECAKNDIRLSVIGRRDRLSPALMKAIEEAEELTCRCEGLHLRIAVDYSGREAILTAARRCGPDVSRETFSLLVEAVIYSQMPAPDVDLLIRTGGEKRLSDFMLWEGAYAELVFSSRMWPEFGAADLHAALREFHSRERRFGSIRDSENKSRLQLEHPRRVDVGESRDCVRSGAGGGELAESGVRSRQVAVSGLGPSEKIPVVEQIEAL